MSRTNKKPSWRRIEVWELRQRKAGAHKSKKDKLEKIEKEEAIEEIKEQTDERPCSSTGRATDL